MSIYASLPGITPDEPCGPPWQYQGSHVLPADDHPRGGELGLALIPSHITRDGRDDQPEDSAPWPWLRLSLDDLRTADPTVILNRAQVAHLIAQLTAWYDSTGDPAASEQHCGEECAEGHVYAGRCELAPEHPAETVHGCPPIGSGLTTCCHRTPFELPRTDRMTEDPTAVTCHCGIGTRAECAVGPAGCGPESGDEQDQDDGELTAEEARALADQLGTQLYRAEDALAFVGECCDIADREGRPVTTAQVREWLKGARCGRQLLADAEAAIDQPETDRA